jgi:hypothetical protein
MLDLLAAEIAQRIGPVALGRVIEALELALRDLAGSVTPEAMPEMSSRLALIRLADGPG